MKPLVAHTMHQRINNLHPKAKAIIEQLSYLFQATAVGLWAIETTSSPLLAQTATTTNKSNCFRQSLPAAIIKDLPSQPQLIDKTSALSILKPFLLKSASCDSALLLPLGPKKQQLALIIILNPTHTSSSLDRLITYITTLLSQDWQEELDYQQQQRQIEEMASQSRQWQAIYNGVQESIVLLDLRGKVLTVNPATEHITGHQAADSIGKHIGEIFPKVSVMGNGIDFPGPSGLYQTLEERRPSDLFEAVVETKDKRHIWVNYTYTPLWDGHGEMIGLVRVTSDVSTIKTVEQMKNDFVSIASHELRTPLGVINGYLNLFLGGQLGELTPDQLTFLERIYHSSSDMSALVEDLLNISRIEAGRLEASIQAFDLSQLISEVLNHLEPRYQSKSIHIKLQPVSAIQLKADRQKVEQALTNIIDNAIKYTYQHGSIVISVKLRDGIVSIVVKDSGVGIQPEHIGHIFEKFYRENNPLSIREGGSGLGLYISRKLVELHGGSISVSSQQQQGSIFTIKLPITAKKHVV
jgi:PAS domain S-box-containing protein